MEEVKKKTHMQIRKTGYNIATIGRRKVVGKPARKWKYNSTIVEIFENNRNKKKKKTKEKELELAKGHN